MVVSCADFEQRWNDWLDAPRDLSVLADALQSHAAQCPTCRPIAERYTRLHLALNAWERGPRPGPELTGRILARLHPPAPARKSSQVAPSWRWAAAASLVLTLGGLSLWLHRTLRPPAGTDLPVAVSRGGFERSLGEALADATEATLDLAWATSAPAARIGRQVMDAEVAQIEPSLSLPRPSGPDPGLLQSVGDEVNEGVRPLSGSARHAFRFLLGPALGEKPAAPPGRGA